MKKHIVRGTPFFPKVSNNTKSYPYLERDISSDVVIVGGGITGALCAYYFMKQNIKTTLVEKSKISMGSTSITTSLLQYALDSLILDLEKDYDINHIIDGYNFGRDGLNELATIINDLKIDCDYKTRDCLLYTDDKDKIYKVKYEYEKRKENGFDVDFIDDTTPGFDFSFHIEAGIYAPNAGAEINPVKLTHALIKRFVQLGGEIFENTEIFDFQDLDKSVLLKTTDNKNIICKKVIVATGYDISAFTTKKYSTLSTTYNIVTSPIENFTGWNNRCFIKTIEDTPSYIRTTADNRIIIGGEDTRFIPEIFEHNVAELQYTQLKEKLNKMFPKLSFEIDYKYNGIFGTTKDNLPYIGADKKNKNIWYCLGYGATGILFAVNGAKMLSALYLGHVDDNFKLVSFDRP